MNTKSPSLNRLLAGVFTAVLATAGIAAGASPAAAGNSRHHKIDYVALGDSYAAGQGGGDILDRCGHTDEAYPLAVDDLRGVRLIEDETCTGATARDLVKDQIPDAKRDLKRAELVTITVGGSDLLSERVAEACDPEDVNDSRRAADDCWKKVKRAIEDVKHWLYKGLHKIDDLNGHVKILVTGYPRFYSDPDDRFERLVNKAIDRLNKALHRTVERADDHGVHVWFVKVTGGFEGHLLDDDDPWLHEDGRDAFHPTEDGHEVYQHLVTKKVKRLF
jgi:lysophospholipase L1-like esterase